jgi:hypothetical protein
MQAKANDAIWESVLVRGQEPGFPKFGSALCNRRSNYKSRPDSPTKPSVGEGVMALYDLTLTL